MNFKKYTEMELLMLASIADMNEEDVEDIKMENGDIDSINMEDCIFVPSYLNKPNAIRHAQRRKNTFKKKGEQKNLAYDLGYDVSTERNSKKVKSMLSANHSDKSYFRGSKAERKHWDVQEEVSIMEQEAVENARECMSQEHNSILGSIMQDLDNLTLDMKSNEHSIEDLKMECKELEETMKVVSEKLQNARLRRTGLMAALLQKEGELDAMSTKLRRERISRFGW